MRLRDKTVYYQYDDYDGFRVPTDIEEYLKRLGYTRCRNEPICTSVAKIENSPRPVIFYPNRVGCLDWRGARKGEKGGRQENCENEA